MLRVRGLSGRNSALGGSRKLLGRRPIEPVLRCFFFGGEKGDDDDAPPSSTTIVSAPAEAEARLAPVPVGVGENAPRPSPVLLVHKLLLMRCLA